MKTTLYFTHDCNSRSDEKIINLIHKEGWAGYGLYWALIEKLYEENGYLEEDYDRIAFDLRTECERITKVIKNYNLFKFKEGFFYSQSLLDRLKIREIRSTKAKESANIRWNNANAMRTECERNAIKIKIKEKKNNILAKAPINKLDLINKLALKKEPIKGLQLWQDEAATAKTFFNCPDDKISSLFKCFKDNQNKARIAFSDCKELNKKDILYFFKVYNELNK